VYCLFSLLVMLHGPIAHETDSRDCMLSWAIQMQEPPWIHSGIWLLTPAYSTMPSASA
jgi:hypothetical protein